MTDIDLDAIRARADAATPGPWHYEHVGDYAEHGCAGHGDYGWITGGPNYPRYDEDSAEGKADAEFIAHARTDIPALLARLAEVEAERDAARRVLDFRAEADRAVADMVLKSEARGRQWAIDVRQAAEALLVLKDGPRDAAYEAAKPEAWEALRAALAARPDHSGG